MKKKQNKNAGIDLLVRQYKKQFRIKENLNYYSEEDYKKVERKYLKFALSEGKV
jgi:hypothetical protein